MINDAKALFKFCETTMQHDIKDVVAYRDGEKITSRSIRQFVYVDRSTVERNRPCSDVKTLKGTRQLHAIRGTGKPFHLHQKHLSCYCPACASSDLTDVNCLNTAYTGTWTNVILAKKSTKCILSVLPSLVWFIILFFQLILASSFIDATSFWTSVFHGETRRYQRFFFGGWGSHLNVCCFGLISLL